MKLICVNIIFLSLVLNIHSIGNNKVYENLKELTTLETPQVTSDYETFDFKTFEKREDKGKPVYESLSNEGTYIQLINTGDELSYSATPKNSYFSIAKEYYPGGGIKEKGLCINTASELFKKGTWYYFNKSGQLVKEVNYDTPFKFTFEDILQFCEKEGIKVEKGYIKSGQYTSIYRQCNENSKDCKWVIDWFKKPNQREIITLDGISGKIISRVEKRFINN